MLAAVPRGRHDDQALPQRLHGRVVLVAEALVDDVGHPPGGVQVQPPVIKQPGPELLGPVLKVLLELGIECHPGASSA